MLEREKGTIAKKYDIKIEEYTNKVTSLEEQLAESDTRAGNLEEKARNAAEEWEAKLADEKSHARDVQNDLEKAQMKMKGMEDELAELRDSCSKIDEYEQVLGKLMERNEELETQVKGAEDEVEMANRQVELLDRRRAAKVKDLEEKVEEQRLVIEQQQETLDESVKTILKLYSLNNTRDDDLSVMSEDKLTDMARAIVPRLGTNRSGLPPIHDEDRGGILSLASGHTSKRPTATTRSMASAGINSSRGRELTEEVENLMQRKSRARSTGRPIDRLESCGTTGSQLTMETHFGPRRSRAKSTGRTHDRLETYNEVDSVTVESQIRPRHMSRGRGGERTESIRQLTDKARTPVRSRSLSPITPRPTSQKSQIEYDPTGPASQSRALVPVMPKESDNSYGGHYDVPPPSRPSSRRELAADRDRGDMYDAPYNESTSYAPRQPAYDKHPLPVSSRAHRSQHQPQSFGSVHPSQRDRREGSERRDSYRQERERDRRERDRGDYRSEQNRDRDSRDRESDRNRGRGGANDPYYREGGPQDRSGGYPSRSGGDRNNSADRYSGGNYRSSGVGYSDPKEEAYPSSRRYTRDPSLAGETEISDDGGGGGWRGNSGRHRGRGRATGRPRRDP